jgi:hypothetical protein
MLLMGQNAMAKRKVTKVLRKDDNSISTSDILPEHLRSTNLLAVNQVLSIEINSS